MIKELQWFFFSFQGRTTRSTYWLGHISVMFLSCLLEFTESPLTILLITPFVIWAALAIQAKRWHDRGRSAWWILCNVVLILGNIYSLVQLGFFGSVEPNRFGPPFEERRPELDKLTNRCTFSSLPNDARIAALAGGVIVLFVLLFGVPYAAGMFVDLGAALPLGTRWLLEISSFTAARPEFSSFVVPVFLSVLNLSVIQWLRPKRALLIACLQTVIILFVMGYFLSLPFQAETLVG